MEEEKKMKEKEMNKIKKFDSGTLFIFAKRISAQKFRGGGRKNYFRKNILPCPIISPKSAAIFKE